MYRAAIASIVGAARDTALGSPDRLSPAACLLLIREYVRTGDDAIAAALGPALGTRLALRETADEQTRGAWLEVFIEAAACTDDERVPAAALSLAHTIVAGWPADYALGRAMREVGACIRAAAVLVGEHDLLREAIDELERVIGAAYAPGKGLVTAFADRAGPSMADHVQAGKTLLTAYASTARVPYSMLAEELVQVMHRRWWDASAGLFIEPGEDPFAANCAAAMLLCRLAALQRDPEYRSSAGGAPGADYAGDAERVLRALSTAARTSADAAAFALAAAECSREES